MNDTGAKRGAWEADELIESRWEDVDEFVSATLAAEDDALMAAVEAGRVAGLPEIQVTPAQGKLLHLLARTIGARRAIEFGTLAGYSTIWLARALPEGGRLVSLESKPEYAEVARANVERAGVGEKVEIQVGPALDSLPGLDGEDPFDLAFIDADKANTPNYCDWALDHVRPGGLVIADNVVRGGTLAEGESEDEATVAQRRLHTMLADDPRADATTIQTVGSKGYDGFTLALVDLR
ncbi:MAG TPA: O-methyltransferase [Solirubrobacterales bacterium]